MALDQSKKDNGFVATRSNMNHANGNWKSPSDSMVPANTPAYPSMHANIMQLQKSLGNQAVMQLFKAQLAVNHPIQRMDHSANPIQRVVHAQGDHVLNDIPGALNGVDDKLKSPVLTELSTKLNEIRHAAGTVDCPGHEGNADPNSVEFGQARLAFRQAATTYANEGTKKSAKAMNSKVDDMWNRSIDYDTRNLYASTAAWDGHVEKWNNLKEGAKGALKDHRSL